MKKQVENVLLFGGLGTIGSILTPFLASKYNLHIADIAKPPSGFQHIFYHLNAMNYDEVIQLIPNNIDVIINLIGIGEKEKIVIPEEMDKMVDIYIKCVYNIYYSAVQLGIPKVIFASSNHVTDYYEDKGISNLNREIVVDDYPLSIGLYGNLKLFGENIGFSFSKNYNLSVICLRIGTVRKNESEALHRNEQFHRTLLSNNDTIDLFYKSIISKKKFGIYYGVSNNPNKPWSINNAVNELNYKPSLNSQDIVSLKKKM